MKSTQQEEIHKLVEHTYTTYINKCNETGVVPTSDYKSIKKIVNRARVVITELLDKHKPKSHPFAAIRIDDNFTHIAQIIHGEVCTGVVNTDALLFQLRGEKNVTQDNNESRNSKLSDSKEMLD